MFVGNMHLPRGHVSVFVERPISAGLLFAALVLIAIVTLPGIRRDRPKISVGCGDLQPSQIAVSGGSLTP
jgi:TctA family transporter